MAWGQRVEAGPRDAPAGERGHELRIDDAFLGIQGGQGESFFTWSVSVNTAVQLPSLPVPAVVAMSRMGRACPPCLRP